MILRKLQLPALAGALALAGWQALSAYSARTELAEQRSEAYREAGRYMSQGMQARATAEAISAAVADRTTRALQEARNASRPPVLCPQSGDVRDAILPGLSDRLRSIRAAGGQDPAADVAPVPASGASH